MIRLDDERMRPLAALSLAAALVIAIAGHRTHDTCARPEALYDTGAIPGSSPGAENEAKPISVFQRTEGEILGTSMRYAIVRAFRADKITREPASYSSSVMIPDEVDLRSIDVDGARLPVHFATNPQDDAVYLAAYALVFDGQPVERVLRHRLATAWSQLVRGRQPLTLLLAWGVAQPSEVASQREIAEGWLAQAWRFYARSCRT